MWVVILQRIPDLMACTYHRCFFAITTIVVISLMSVQSSAQVYTNRLAGLDYLELLDTLQPDPYPYLLPIMGEKVVAKGYNLPYSAGLSINYLGQNSDIVIENLQIGFNGGELYNLDDIVVFDDARSTSNSINVRPDIWLFPFLNIYGILAKSYLSTEVNFEVRVPTGTGYATILEAGTVAEFEAVTTGFGITPTIGIEGYWAALDINFTWSDIEALDQPAAAFVFGPRFGKSFKFKKPDQTLAVWVGGFRLDINTGTSGNLPVDDLFDFTDINMKIDNAYGKLEGGEQALDDWWNALTPPQQAQNFLRYEAAKLAIEKTYTLVGSLDDAVNNVENSTIQYSLDKRQKDKWNLIVGSQFQLNNSLMFRGEFGFLGSRTQWLAGLQYRFRL